MYKDPQIIIIQQDNGSNYKYTDFSVNQTQFLEFFSFFKVKK